MGRSQLRLECFEQRIVPAAVVKFTEADLDKVTVRTSKGTTAQLELALGIVNGATGIDGFEVGLIKTPTLAAAFAGTNIKITASGAGNKLADYVEINAFNSDNADNIDLGNVSLKGNLVYIDAGDEDLTTLAVKKLTVTNWVIDDGDTAATSSQIRGNIGSIVVKEDFDGYIFSNALDASENFQDSDGTVIGSFTAKHYGFSNGDQAAFLQVRGITKLKITGNFQGTTNGSTDNGVINAVFIDSMSINGFDFTAKIELFPSN